jgi:hypothetical protein
MDQAERKPHSSVVALAMIMATSGLVVVLVALALQPGARADALTSAERYEIGEVTAIFEGSPSTTESPSVRGLIDTSNIAKGTARRIGAVKGGEYWVAASTTGEICLIGLLLATEFAAITCADVRSVMDHGIGLQLANTEVALRAYFVPDGFTVVTGQFEYASANLIVSDATVPSEENPLEVISSETGRGLGLRTFDRLQVSEVSK